MISRLTIVAPGLLGASLGMAVRARGLAQSVAVYARRPEAAAEALAQDWCDAATTDLASACADAEVIFLCAPVERIIALCRDLAHALPPGNKPIVSDVGSVKGEIVRRCAALLAGKGRFVGSHPMAGSEKSGMAHADANLFAGRPCFVTPLDTTDRAAADCITGLWKGVGGNVVVETPERHDEIVANVSHLPHIVASVLATFLAGSCPDAANYCGNGLRDTTRVASGDPALWREIIAQNRPEILRAIGRFQDQLQSFRAAIANENDFEVLRQLADGKRFRDGL